MDNEFKRFILIFEDIFYGNRYLFAPIYLPSLEDAKIVARTVERHYPVKCKKCVEWNEEYA